MADRMKNDQRNMGAGDKDKNYGQQQSPGRSGQRDQQQAGQHSGGQFGGQKKPHTLDKEEDDFGAGRAGTQNRPNQNR